MTETGGKGTSTVLASGSFRTLIDINLSKVTANRFMVHLRCPSCVAKFKIAVLKKNIVDKVLLLFDLSLLSIRQTSLTVIDN
jgi:hypothetical protein